MDFGLDGEMEAFIARVSSYYPDGDAPLSVDLQRASYNAMCRAFHAGYPDRVSSHDETLPGAGGPIQVRRYRPGDAEPAATVVYLHGGGYILGGLESHDDVCAEICAHTGFSVVAVDYRLAPEHLHPAGFDDALAAFRAIAKEGRPVVLAGDSAGANMAAAICLSVRGEPVQPAGQVLIYPAFGGENLGLASYEECAEAPMLSLKETLAYKRLRAGGPPPTDDPTFAPLMAGDFAGLPPAAVFSAGVDPLRDDGGEFVKRLTGAGGKAVWHCEAGLTHSYLRARHMSQKAAASFERICAAIREMGAA